MDMDDYPEVESGDGDNGAAELRKPFYLLNALSDLLMIPKDVLMETSTRKEACTLILFNKCTLFPSELVKFSFLVIILFSNSNTIILLFTALSYLQLINHQENP
jgi:hypothetical protein